MTKTTTTWQRSPACIAALMLCAVASTAAAGPLQVENGRLLDKDGGDVVLRGLNLSQGHKKPPFRPNQDPALFTKLTAIGINAVRLQFNWEAYESAPGVYDESYLDYYAGVVDRARASNVYVVVDMHQDGFSRWTLSGCGEGFPKWSIPPGSLTVDQPDNGIDCKNWPTWANLRRPELDHMFNAFLAPGNMAREHLLIVMEKIARRLAGKSNVIGYEPMNEPFGGAEQLMQLHRDAATRIRAIDPTAIIFMCPEMWTDPGVMDTRLTDPSIPNLVYAPHYYDLVIYNKLWSLLRYEWPAQRNRDRAKGWGGAAVVLGEFGAPPSTVTPAYLDMIYNDLEKHGESGIQWGYTPEWTPQANDGFNFEDFSIVDDKGQLRANYKVRPYVRRTAAPTYGQWTKSDGAGFLGRGPRIGYTWQHEPARGATEIFLPKGYFDGKATPKVSVSPATAKCVLQADGQLLSCTSYAAGKVSVTVN